MEFECLTCTREPISVHHQGSSRASGTAGEWKFQPPLALKKLNQTREVSVSLDNVVYRDFIAEIIKDKNLTLNNLNWHFTQVIMTEKKLFLKIWLQCFEKFTYYIYKHRRLPKSRAFWSAESGRTRRLYRGEFLKVNALQQHFQVWLCFQSSSPLYNFSSSFWQQIFGSYIWTLYNTIVLIMQPNKKWHGYHISNDSIGYDSIGNDSIGNDSIGKT